MDYRQEILDIVNSSKRPFGIEVSDFLKSKKTKSRARYKKEIDRLLTERVISGQRTSYIFMYNPVTKTQIGNCKEGSKNHKAILNFYAYDGHYFYSTIQKRV